MKRRHTVRSLLERVLPMLALVLGTLTTGESAQQTGDPATAGADRPNLLVVMVDDMRYDELGWMPHVRRWLRDGGVEFRNSFSPFPLCCPARASFLSGQLAHNHGVLSHDPPYGFTSFDDRRTLATSLQGAGYRTMFVGKYLNGYGMTPTHRTGLSSASYVPPGWDSWQAGVELTLPPYDPLAGSTYDYFDTTLNVDGSLAGNEGAYSTELYARGARAGLAEAHEADQPWFMYLSLLAPHHGDPVEYDDPSPRWLTGEDGEPLPATYLTPARPDWVKGIADTRLTRSPGIPRKGQPVEDMSDRPYFLRSWPRLDDVDRASILEMARQRAESLVVADLEIDRTLRQLRADGELDDTVVAFTSDNGYFLGEHRQREGKLKAHEPSLRVPLLIRGPGIEPGVRYDPATTVDLSATLLDYGRAPVPHEPDGVSLRPVIARGDQGWRRPVVTEALIPRMRPEARNTRWPDLSSVGLRLPRYSYTRYSNGAAELYDLARDPLELRNLHNRKGGRRVERAVAAVWRRSLGCVGSVCTAALPARLSVDVDVERAITEAQERARIARFGSSPSLSVRDVAAWRRRS